MSGGKGCDVEASLTSRMRPDSSGAVRHWNRGAVGVAEDKSSHNCGSPWHLRAANVGSHCQSSSAAAHFSVAAQQFVSSACELQHEALLAQATVDSCASFAAAATTYSGGSTALAFAQASFSPSVWQQQPRQHPSALWQPQWLCMQGNGWDKSLPPGPNMGVSTGTPTIAVRKPASDSSAVQRRSGFGMCRAERNMPSA